MKLRKGHLHCRRILYLYRLSHRGNPFYHRREPRQHTSIWGVLPLLLLLLSRFSRVQLCYPIDGSPPGSSVHGIFQVRILEWVAISFSRGSLRPKAQTCCVLHWEPDSIPLSHRGSPQLTWRYPKWLLNFFFPFLTSSGDGLILVHLLDPNLSHIFLRCTYR